ncbi:hypothetical protein K2173_001760 [Erythroxylum novogranatense]|uniref:Uncharacterized protein n=1 Tax=Erythroxylum novogranatense TaxID=1862640 RepID=A0AAV8SJK9_9ROSI|nr:hypothetical protein K2173_001760 [Erythroxylum novogranatense]
MIFSEQRPQPHVKLNLSLVDDIRDDIDLFLSFAGSKAIIKKEGQYNGTQKLQCQDCPFALRSSSPLHIYISICTTSLANQVASEVRHGSTIRVLYAKVLLFVPLLVFNGQDRQECKTHEKQMTPLPYNFQVIFRVPSLQNKRYPCPHSLYPSPPYPKNKPKTSSGTQQTDYFSLYLSISTYFVKLLNMCQKRPVLS